MSTPPTLVTRCSRRSRLRVFILVGVVIAAGAAVGYVLYHHQRVPNHWGRVTRRVLYRSAQPEGPMQWQFIARRGIRTIVDLCPRQEDPSSYDEERLVCAARGIRLLSLPVTASLPSDGQIRAFLQAVQEGGRVLVHCQHGRGRTGVMVASYRVVIQNRAVAEAMRDMRNHGWHPDTARDETKTRDLLARLKRDRNQWLAMTTPSLVVN